MDPNDKEVFLELIQNEDTSFMFFHTYDNPYAIQYLKMDEDWKTNPFQSVECQFIPKSVKSYRDNVLSIIYSEISCSIVNTVSPFLIGQLTLIGRYFGRNRGRNAFAVPISNRRHLSITIQH